MSQWVAHSGKTTRIIRSGGEGTGAGDMLLMLIFSRGREAEKQVDGLRGTMYASIFV